jgi:hypothetical protein
LKIFGRRATHPGLEICDQFKIMKTQIGALDSERGRNFCRACNAKKVIQVLDLGNLPIANELPKTNQEIIDLFPLCFGICNNCGLGQVGEPVSRERLFSDYRYLSSISATWLSHAQNFAHDTVEALKLTPKDLVIEIASNDGYLLQYFKKYGIKVLGVEPAKNIAEKANLDGIETISDFFGIDTAKEIKNARGAPNLIIANNVAAHVPNLRDFFGGLEILAGDQTLISIENPSILNLLKENQFDTIYHEHYSYLSAFAIRNLGTEFNLNLYKVESISTHGGSNRYWFKRGELTELERIDLDDFINTELRSGLMDMLAWSKFANNVTSSLENLRVWLEICKQEGRRVFGFTAAAKASTILNAAKISHVEISGIADSSPEKIGRFLPSLGVPIISIEDLKREKPTDILIFAWNISHEISTLVWKELGDNVRCWTAIPDLKELIRAK